MAPNYPVSLAQSARHHTGLQAADLIGEQLSGAFDFRFGSRARIGALPES